MQVQHHRVLPLPDWKEKGKLAYLPSAVERPTSVTV